VTAPVTSLDVLPAPGRDVGTEGSDGLETDGVVTCGTVTEGTVTAGVVTAGVVTAGVVTAGVVTVGVVTAGIVTVGFGTFTDGTVSALLARGSAPKTGASASTISATARMPRAIRNRDLRASGARSVATRLSRRVHTRPLIRALLTRARDSQIAFARPIVRG
jgi:hypothetical protein